MNYVRPPRVIDRDEKESCEYWKVFWEKYERMGGKYRLPPCPIPVDDPDYYVKLNEWYKDHHHDCKSHLKRKNDRTIRQ